MRKTTPLVQNVADRLSADMKHYAVLPPVSVLCERYDVSHPILRAALHLLQSKGILTISQGRRARRAGVGEAPLPPQPSPTSADQLYADLRRRIRDGEIRASTPLPKLGYFAVVNRMSTHTVRDVYRRLVRDGVAHRRGKFTFAGANPQQVSLVKIISNGVILVLSNKLSTWTGIFRSSRTEQFGQSLCREAENHGIRIIQAATRRSAGQLQAPSGLREVRQYIGKLGGSFVGALIVGVRNQVEDLGDWVRLLDEQKKPLVWLDQAGEGCREKISSPYFTRCYYDEARAVKACIDYLRAMGHRTAGYVYTNKADWQERRLEFLGRFARSGHEKLCILPERFSAGILLPPLGELAAMLDPLSQHPRWGKALRVFRGSHRRLMKRYGAGRPDLDRNSYGGVCACERFCRDHPERVDPADAALVRGLWGVFTLRNIARKGATVLIAPNDNHARSLYLGWCEGMRMSVPRDISIISFDHEFRESFFPLTSIDFGFDYLGHQAFHALLGDAPVARDRHNGISGKPTVIDRGSVGVAR